jgi:hypothetical protein
MTTTTSTRYRVILWKDKGREIPRGWTDSGPNTLGDASLLRIARCFDVEPEGCGTPYDRAIDHAIKHIHGSQAFVQYGHKGDIHVYVPSQKGQAARRLCNYYGASAEPVTDEDQQS